MQNSKKEVDMEGIKVLRSTQIIILGICFVTVSILVSMLRLPMVFAEDNVATKKMNEVAEELVLKEVDFDFKAYEDSLKKLNSYFEEWWEQDNYSESTQAVVLKVDWAMFNIGVRNHFLVLRGYGLISQKQILVLKLENARLKKASKETMVGLEKQLKEIDRQIDAFLSENQWVD